MNKPDPNNADLWTAYKMVENPSDVLFAETLSKRRRRAMTQVRHQMMFLLHTWGYSCSAIGRAFNRDHSSVVLALRKFK